MTTKSKVQKKLKTTQKPIKKVKKAKGSAKSMLGQAVPSIELLATGSQKINLQKLKGTKVVLYFYPRDKTPGCTLEGHEFTKLKAEFSKNDTQVFGVSADSLQSHESFKESCGFKVDLIEDKDQKLCRAFDVIQMKNMYGRKYEGIERSTFVIDEKGIVHGEWRKVKVPGHAQEVLNFVKTL